MQLLSRPAREDDIALYHTRAHIDRIWALCMAGGGEASTLEGESTPVVPASYEAALLADPFGCSLEQIDAVLLNPLRHSFLPPDRKRRLIETHRQELRQLKARWIHEP